jgi:hypothetical protein
MAGGVAGLPRERRLVKLDGEPVPHSELVELAIGQYHGNGPLLANVRRLGLWIPHRPSVVVVAISALGLGGVVVLVLVVVIGDLVFVEVSRSKARVELPRPERDPVVGVECVRRIFSEIDRQDGSAAVHLITALSALACHRRD